jgi:hypothetical protein
MPRFSRPWRSSSPTPAWRSTDMRPFNPLRLVEIAPDMTPIRKLVLAVAPALALSLASPAMAAAPNTRLVSCGAEDCLLVTGYRESRADVVRINGHRVEVEGKRHWRARLPVATVRNWSVPFARRIEVSVQDAAAQTDTLQYARLPIGLLGHAPDLASLVITLH